MTVLSVLKGIINTWPLKTSEHLASLGGCYFSTCPVPCPVSPRAATEMNWAHAMGQTECWDWAYNKELILPHGAYNPERGRYCKWWLNTAFHKISGQEIGASDVTQKHPPGHKHWESPQGRAVTQVARMFLLSWLRLPQWKLGGAIYIYITHIFNRKLLQHFPVLCAIIPPPNKSSLASLPNNPDL